MERIDLNELNSRIPGIDSAAVQSSLDRWSVVAKPLKSLGVLEDLVTQIAGVKGKARFSIKRRMLAVMCADHGVIAQGVTQTDESITALVAADLAKDCSSANLMAHVAGCDVCAVDVGIKNSPDLPGIVNKRVAPGTADFTQGPAMTREQALQAVWAGIDTAESCASEGYDLLLSGEMGIGNTTAGTAVTCALLGLPPEKITGRGAGLSTEGLARKVDAIKRGFKLNRPNPADALDVLSKMGGFEIAAMAGFFIGSALFRLPVVIDGVTCAVAALAAAKLCPACRDAMLPSHMSSEPAAERIFDALDMRPVINAGLHLGEGTGALCLLPLLDMAMSLYDGLVFSDIGMDAYTPQE